jgi:hypothetical protein
MGGSKAIIDWLILPALILIVVLAIVTARPKHGWKNGEDEGLKK